MKYRIVLHQRRYYVQYSTALGWRWLRSFRHYPGNGQMSFGTWWPYCRAFDSVKEAQKGFLATRYLTHSTYDSCHIMDTL